MGTTKTVRIEKRQRGVVGWVFLILFWAFNALMAFGLFAGLDSATKTAAGLTSEAEQAGAAIGTAIGASMIVSIWMAGAVILGIFVMLTRGKKIIVETTEG